MKYFLFFHLLVSGVVCADTKLELFQKERYSSALELILPEKGFEKWKRCYQIATQDERVSAEFIPAHQNPATWSEMISFTTINYTGMYRFDMPISMMLLKQRDEDYAQVLKSPHTWDIVSQSEDDATVVLKAGAYVDATGLKRDPELIIFRIIKEGNKVHRVAYAARRDIDKVNINKIVARFAKARLVVAGEGRKNIDLESGRLSHEFATELSGHRFGTKFTDDTKWMGETDASQQGYIRNVYVSGESLDSKPDQTIGIEVVDVSKDRQFSVSTLMGIVLSAKEQDGVSSNKETTINVIEKDRDSFLLTWTVGMEGGVVRAFVEDGFFHSVMIHDRRCLHQPQGLDFWLEVAKRAKVG